MQKRQEAKMKTSRRIFLGDVTKSLTAATLISSASLSASAQKSPALFKSASEQSASGIGFVIHGGAGTITRGAMSAELERQYRDKLTEAVTTGYNVLQRGGSSLDAVEAAIRIMEDSPLFNAGKGAVFTSAGTNELDASIMDGSNLKAGAVAVLRHIKNPISLARMVMERSPHVMLVGEGAEEFAKQQGVALVPQSYFFTERRWREYLKQKEQEKKQTNAPRNKTQGDALSHFIGDKHGTVGAAALDKQGNLAAGTSTGGISMKRFGRVGDSPIIGAGTYANNLTCAISATGDGEYFIRSVVAHDISALMQYSGKSLPEAMQIVIGKVGNLGGTGGVIGIDRNGQIAHFFNTEGMYRARISSAENKPVVEIYRD